MASQQWGHGEVVAWTEREGPGRPPEPPAPWLWYATTGGLGVALSAVFAGDTLCPEHRAWVQALGGFAFVAVITSVVALWRRAPYAPVLTVAAAAAGVAIGTIDAVHSPVRGTVIALAFLATACFATWLLVAHRPLRAWDRHLHTVVAPLARSSADDAAVVTSAERSEARSDRADSALAERREATLRG